MSNSTNFDWLSDLSPLFQAQESWFEGSYQKSVSLCVLAPKETPFVISCGGGLLADHIRRFRFSPALIQRLGQVTEANGRSVFHESFLNHLQRLRLRINVLTAPEGTLLLPGEPLLIIQGAWIQALLLESAFRWLIWDSTQQATMAALDNWNKGHFSEEDTPHPESFAFNPAGWKQRALYIGGATDPVEYAAAPWPGMQEVTNAIGQPLFQIRRLFQGDLPLGDVWLSQTDDYNASVSRTHIEFFDRVSAQPVQVQMTRYQNVYQPVLLKGHPLLAGTSLDYLRQRTWKQLEAFHQVDLKNYPQGWYQT